MFEGGKGTGFASAGKRNHSKPRSVGPVNCSISVHGLGETIFKADEALPHSTLLKGAL